MHFLRVAARCQKIKLSPYFLIVDYCRVSVSGARTLVRLGMDLAPPPPASPSARSGGGGVGQLVGGHHVPGPGLERLPAYHPHPPEVVHHGGVGGALGGHALSVRVILVFLVPPGDGLGGGKVFRQDLPVALGCGLGARVPWERRQLIREVGIAKYSAILPFHPGKQLHFFSSGRQTPRAMPSRSLQLFGQAGMAQAGPTKSWSHSHLIETKQEQTLFKDLRRQDIEIKKDETKKGVRPLKWIFKK